MEGSGRSLLEDVIRPLPWNEENHEKSLSG
jgi:hypothetical protein